MVKTLDELVLLRLCGRLLASGVEMLDGHVDAADQRSG